MNNIAAVELIFTQKTSIAYRVPNFWMGYVYKFRVNKLIIDTVHTKQNPVCCHIGNFPLLLAMFLFLFVWIFFSKNSEVSFSETCMKRDPTSKYDKMHFHLFWDQYTQGFIVILTFIAELLTHKRLSTNVVSD